MNITRLSDAELLLKKYAISSPEDIDLEAIAWAEGAKVRYRPLEGCEAYLLGTNDRAIINVNSRSSKRRRRFSLAHELGHWRFHRGQRLYCRTEGAQRSEHNPAVPVERQADEYAADLLMPHFIFDPIARSFSKLTFRIIEELSEIFMVSKTAAAIRVVEGKFFTAMLVCHGPNGRKWFCRGPEVPDRWFPRNDLDPEGFAMGVLRGVEDEDSYPKTVGADAWFDRPEAHRYDIREQTIRTGDTETLTLLLIDDDQMLEDWGSKLRVYRR